MCLIMQPEDDVQKDLFHMLGSAFPEFSGSSVQLLDTGWENYVLVLDGRIAFKIPRSPANAERLVKEVELTDCLADSPIHVPAFRYRKNTVLGFVAGYDFIPGKPLNSVRTLSDALVAQLSGFLSYLHAKSSDACVTAVLGTPDTDVWRERYTHYREQVFNLMIEVASDNLLSEMATIFDRYLNQHAQTMKLSLVHGDLYRGNVLVDTAAGEISGIIDWGTAEMGDPALDFAALAVDFSPDQIKDVISSYTGIVDSNFMKRVEFYWKLEPTFGIQYFRHRDVDAHRRLLIELERRLETGLF